MAGTGHNGADPCLEDKIITTIPVFSPCLQCDATTACAGARWPPRKSERDGGRKISPLVCTYSNLHVDKPDQPVGRRSQKKF